MLSLAILCYVATIYCGTIVALVIPAVNRAVIVVCFLVAVYFVLVTGAAGDARFRAPSLVFLMAIYSPDLIYIADSLRTRLLESRD